MSDYEKEKALEKEVKKSSLLDEEMEEAFEKTLKKQKRFEIDYPDSEEETENPKAKERRLLREQKEKELEEEQIRQEKEAEDEALRRQDERREKSKKVIVLDIEKEKELKPKEKEIEKEEERENPCCEENEEDPAMEATVKKRKKGMLWIVLGVLITLVGVVMSAAGLLPYGIFAAAAGIVLMLIGFNQKKKSMERMDNYSADKRK